jgi:DNA-binding NarL/FixJ family response regulator
VEARGNVTGQNQRLHNFRLLPYRFPLSRTYSYLTVQLTGEGLQTARILLADDFQPFRQFVVKILGDRPELQIVYQASDGAEAVEQAKLWQPDLVLLDIGLPALNGFEAAAQIHIYSPKSKILFVSQESSSDIVSAAFSLGACGYLLKADAGAELLAAIDAVLRGARFVSSRLAGMGFTLDSEEQSS